MEKQRHTVIPRTICLVYNKRSEILLIKFSQAKGKLEGFFDPPGGHIELGEGIVENTIKEVKEETGIDIENVRLVGLVHVTNFFGKNILLHVTLSDAINSELNESPEGKPVWVEINKIAELKIFEDLKIIIEKVASQKDKVFTAKSIFDNEGKLIEFAFE